MKEKMFKNCCLDRDRRLQQGSTRAFRSNPTCTQQNVSQLTDAQQRPSRTAGLRQHTDLSATNPTFTVDDMAQHGPASSQASAAAAAGLKTFVVPVRDRRMGGKVSKRRGKVGSAAKR